MADPLILPRLQQGELVLRSFSVADIDLVIEAGSDPLIPLITSVPTAPASDDALRAFIHRQGVRASSGQGYSFAIADADTNAGVGQVGLWPLTRGRASVGYWVVPSARRRGIAQRALVMVSEWGLTLPDLCRLELYVEPWNEGSWRAAERAGYEREGLLRSWQAVGHRRRDMFMYSRVAPPGLG